MEKLLYVLGGALVGYGAAYLVSTSRGFPPGATSPLNPVYYGGAQPGYPVQGQVVGTVPQGQLGISQPVNTLPYMPPVPQGQYSQYGY